MNTIRFMQSTSKKREKKENGEIPYPSHGQVLHSIEILDLVVLIRNNLQSVWSEKMFSFRINMVSIFETEIVMKRKMIEIKFDRNIFI